MNEARKSILRLKRAWLDYRLARAERKAFEARHRHLRAMMRLAIFDIRTNRQAQKGS